MTRFGMISFVVVFIVFFTNAVCHLTDGPGVCKKDKMFKAESVVWKSWKSERNSNSQQETTFCCEGYEEKNNMCVYCPDCTSMNCPENYCGDTCIEMCDCPLNAYCDRRLCCRCKPGLHGVYCNETCAKGYYGPRCKHKCKCKRHEKCDSGTGNCTSNTSNTSTICKPETTFNKNLNNAVSIESNLSPDGIGDTSGNQPQVTEVFKIIVIAGMIGGITIIIIINILCKISWSKDRTEHHSVEDGPNTCSETAGHYVEINPNDEINQEELERLQEPFNLHPSNTNDVIQKLQSVQCNAYFKATHFTDTTAMSHLDGGCKMHKHFSLPNLSNNKKHEVRNIVVKKLKSQSCDHLKHNSLSISDDDYLNPYCSLIRSGLIESDYLNPYTTLVNAFEKGINSID